MKNVTPYESLPQTKMPVIIKRFKNHNSEGRIHFHEEIEILYFTEGEGHVLVNMQEHRAKAGDIIFVNGNELHAGSFGDVSGVYYCIQVRTDFFHNLIGDEYVIFQNHIKDGLAAKLIDTVIAESEKVGFSSILAIKKALFQLFSHLSEHFAVSVLSESEYKKRFMRLDTFNSVIEYIDAHYAEPLSVEDIAGRFYISASYFSHLFKKRAKKSLVEYLNGLRIRHARSLLEKDDLCIGEVAMSVGFNDLNYFSRRFKKETGKTPTEYRRRYRSLG